MKYLLSSIFTASLLLGCGAGFEMDQQSSLTEDDIICVGSPDTSIVCMNKSDIWNCEGLPNAAKKCTLTPDGNSGWNCKNLNGSAVCTSSSPAGGSVGWDCVTANITTCTSVVPISSTPTDTSSIFTPPGGGSWNCTVGEMGVVCTSSSDNSGSGDDSGNSSGPNGGITPKQPTLPKAGDFRTQTPGGWGAPAHGNNAGAYRDAHFAATFPTGLVIGCDAGHTATFTTAKSIEIFLPAGGTPRVLSQNYIDPESTSAGVLAGHVVAATLALNFDLKYADFGRSAMRLKDLVAASGACKGMSVGQILALANNIVGGCSKQMAPSAMTGCVDAINNNFVDGTKAGGYLRLP